MTEQRSYQGFNSKDSSSRMRVTVCTSDGELEVESRVEEVLGKQLGASEKRSFGYFGPDGVCRMPFCAWHSLLFFRHHHPVFASALSKFS